MIKNETLNQNLEVILNKNRDSIIPSDLVTIEGVCFSKSNKEGVQMYSFNELLLLPNLSRLTINTSMITKDDIVILSQLPNLKSLEFTTCIIKEDVDYSILETLEKLSISRCFVNNFQIISTTKGLKSLELFFPYNENDDDLNINDISSKDTLETMVLEGCDITNPTSFSKFSKLKTLNLLSTTVQHFDFVNHMDSLETIYVGPRYRNDENLKKTNIIVHFSKSGLVMDNVDGSKNLI